MTKEELEAMGIFGVESESELAVKPEKNHEFAQNHHGMMSGSSIGLIIIEPASEAEIAEATKRLDVAINALAAKGLDVDYCTKEEAVKAKAKGLYEEWEVASRALTRLQNTEFGQTAKSYLDEIVSQRRRVFNPKRPKKFNGNAATRWGNNQEEESVKRFEAMQAYEGLTGLKLEKTGDKQEFVRLGYVNVSTKTFFDSELGFNATKRQGFDFSEWFGCTPDSIETVGELIRSVDFEDVRDHKIPREFKNPSSGVVFDRYRELKTPLDLKKENVNYYWQVIAQMACLDAPFAQWIAYDCDVINEAERFVVIDFERDLAVERALIDLLFKAVQYIQERI